MLLSYLHWPCPSLPCQNPSFLSHNCTSILSCRLFSLHCHTLSQGLSRYRISYLSQALSYCNCTPQTGSGLRLLPSVSHCYSRMYTLHHGCRFASLSVCRRCRMCRLLSLLPLRPFLWSTALPHCTGTLLSRLAPLHILCYHPNPSLSSSVFRPSNWLSSCPGCPGIVCCLSFRCSSLCLSICLHCHS